MKRQSNFFRPEETKKRERKKKERKKKEKRKKEKERKNLEGKIDISDTRKEKKGRNKQIF